LKKYWRFSLSRSKELAPSLIVCILRFLSAFRTFVADWVFWKDNEAQIYCAWKAFTILTDFRFAEVSLKLESSLLVLSAPFRQPTFDWITIVKSITRRSHKIKSETFRFSQYPTMILKRDFDGEMW
jgi:hypothetical protein